MLPATTPTGLGALGCPPVSLSVWASECWRRQGQWRRVHRYCHGHWQCPAVAPPFCPCLHPFKAGASPPPVVHALALCFLIFPRSSTAQSDGCLVEERKGRALTCPRVPPDVYTPPLSLSLSGGHHLKHFASWPTDNHTVTKRPPWTSQKRIDIGHSRRQLLLH